MESGPSLIEDLLQFKENFVLDTDSVSRTNTNDRETLRQSSLELEQEKDKLKSFQKSFNLLLLEKNDDHQQNVPTQLTLNQQPGNTSKPPGNPGNRNRKKHRRKPPKLADFADLYEMTGEILGKGAESSVVTCIHRKSGKEFAVKVVPKISNRQREKVLREVEILYLSRGNKSILHLIESFEDEKCFYLVFDKIPGGPLLAHIQKRERFTEREASEVVREVAEALSFLHQRGVAHRDLKPDNILCKRIDQVVPICICDFDLSSMVTSGSSTQATPVTTPMLHTPVGSAEYMAPEVVDTFLCGEEFSYDKKCDLWSLGVILYMMLSGRPPFNGGCGNDCGWDNGKNCPQCQDLLLAKIKKCEYSFPDDNWKEISEEAKDLIGQLLQISAKLRPSAQQVLHHPWLQQEGAPDMPLQTPGILNRFPSIHLELSNYAGSCLHHKRRLSNKALESDQLDSKIQQLPGCSGGGGGCGLSSSSSRSPRTFSLSPPGSSELAFRRNATSSVS